MNPMFSGLGFHSLTFDHKCALPEEDSAHDQKLIKNEAKDHR